jgi:lambda family phage portal protein
MPSLTQRLRQRVAQFIAPPAARRRLPAAQARRFDAARVDRLTSEWWTANASINEELRSDLDRLRARARDLAKNNDYARKFIGMCQGNIVGPDGFRLQARVVDDNGRTPDRLANQAIEAAFAEWAAAADITGTMSLRDVCETLVGSLPTDGEFLVRMVRGAAAGNRYNFALELIDADRIDTQHTELLANGNRVVMGVEQDEAGRTLALHLYQSHPNDLRGAQQRRKVRVPVAELIHRFRVDVPGQARGVPWMAPGMVSLHHLGGFMLSALLAAENGANHYGFFRTPDGLPPVGSDEAGDGQQITTSQPGTFDTLPPGVEFQAFDSKYPEQNFGPFVKTTLQRIASGWRVAYHSLANDLEGVNFSSIRSGTLEERDRWASDQAWFIGAFLRPMFNAWLQQALLSGAVLLPNGSALPASRLAKFSMHEWQARRWDWVDPRADMEAKAQAVRAGLIAPQTLAAQMGQDFEDVLQQIGEAQALAQRYGVTLTAYQGAPGATPAAQPAPAPAPAPAEAA